MTRQDSDERAYQEYQAQQERARRNGRKEEPEPIKWIPIVSLRELMSRELPERQFLIEPHLAAGETTLLSALERSYKSFMAMTWAVCVASGVPAFGKFKTKQGRVLILDLENDQGRLRERIVAALDAQNARLEDAWDRFDLFDRYTAKQRLTLTNGALVEMRQLVDHLKPSLIVLDNMRKAWPDGVDENVSAQVNPILNELIDLSEMAGAALVLVSHDRKDGMSHAGSGSLASTPGNVVKLVKDRKTGISQVKCESSRNGPEWEPFHVTIRDHALYLADPNQGKEPTSDDKVFQALHAKGKMTIRQLIDLTDLGEMTVRRAVGSLLTAKRIVKIPGLKGSEYGVSSMEEWL